MLPIAILALLAGGGVAQAARRSLIASTGPWNPGNIEGYLLPGEEDWLATRMMEIDLWHWRQNLLPQPLDSARTGDVAVALSQGFARSITLPTSITLPLSLRGRSLTIKDSGDGSDGIDKPSDSDADYQRFEQGLLDRVYEEERSSIGNELRRITEERDKLRDLERQLIEAVSRPGTTAEEKIKVRDGLVEVADGLTDRNAQIDELLRRGAEIERAKDILRWDGTPEDRGEELHRDLAKTEGEIEELAREASRIKDRVKDPRLSIRERTRLADELGKTEAAKRAKEHKIRELAHHVADYERMRQRFENLRAGRHLFDGEPSAEDIQRVDRLDLYPPRESGVFPRFLILPAMMRLYPGDFSGSSWGMDFAAKGRRHRLYDQMITELARRRNLGLAGWRGSQSLPYVPTRSTQREFLDHYNFVTMLRNEPSPNDYGRASEFDKLRHEMGWPRYYRDESQPSPFKWVRFDGKPSP